MLPTFQEVAEENIVITSSSPTPMGLGLAFEESKDPIIEENFEEPDIPETQNLLPPLPSNESGLITPRLESSEVFKSEAVTPSTPSVKKQSKNITVTSPAEVINEALSNDNSCEKEENGDVLTYSPAINIHHRFEVSMDIPLVTESGSPPKTIEEKIKLYEHVQKKEISEFDKTLKNLKKSGWMTDKELLQLEDAKLDNFNQWEYKIKGLKQTMNRKIHKTDRDNEYFNEINDDKSVNRIVSSPSLQNLEKKFSSLEM